MPSWGFLALMGLIGGGPTFLGTLIGQAWVSPALEIGVLRGRRRLDPLRRDPAVRGLQALRDADARRLDAPARAAARLRHRLGARRRRGLNGHDRLPDLAWAPHGRLPPRSRRLLPPPRGGASGSFLWLAIACHVVKLVFRAGAWRAIVQRRVPERALKFRSAFGAYVAGVGVNSIVPARGGDVVKMYLVKQRIQDANYATLAPDADRRDDVRLRRRRSADRLGARDRRAADAPGLLAHPDRRLEVLPAARAADRHRARRAPGRRRSSSSSWRRRRYRRSSALTCARASRSSATAALRARRDRAAGDLVGLRIASLFFFLKAFGVDREPAQRAARAGRRLARDAVPGDAGRRRDEAGADRVPVPRQRRLAHAAACVQRRHEHRDRRRRTSCSGCRDRADGEDALVQAGAHARRAKSKSSRSARPEVPFASVYPLVTARAVAREFTYEVDEGVGVGAIVRVPFGRSRARGIVVSLDDAAPDGRRRTADRVGDRGGPAGARRARAVARRLLRLDAGARARARRARDAEAAQGAGAAGRAAGARRRSRSRCSCRRRRSRRVDRIVDGDRRRRRQPAAVRRDRIRARPRCTSRRARRRSSAGSARSCSCRRSRSRRRRSAAFRQRFGERVAILHSALTDAERRDERARIASGEARDRRRRALGDLRARARARPDRRRRGARRVVQAGLRPALRRAHGRREARVARRRGRRLRLGDAAARELGGARAARARRPDRRRAAAGAT